jgi:ribonuclease Y
MIMTTEHIIIMGLVALLFGGGLGWMVHHLQTRAQARAAGNLMEATRKEAEAILRDARLSAQEEYIKARASFEKETKERREQIAEAERRMIQRETNLDRKVDLLDRKTDDVTRKEQQVTERARELHKLQSELDELKRLSQQELQRIAGMGAEEAKRALLKRVEEEVQAEASAMTSRIVEAARTRADEEARRLVTIAIERLASSQVQAVTSCTMTLPNDEMKGRIIGREGRNIRAFEAATGINVLIDDTPHAVVLSGFDPVRREVARQTLERLVEHGRINPARIEEEVVAVTKELDEMIYRAGDDAVVQLGLQAVNPEIIKLLGRLKYRHSFAQNVLDHSIEVGHIEGLMAAELGLDQQIGKRVGLFHDIGKSVDHEVEGAHALIGGDLLKKYGEPEVVWRAVASHHHEVEPVTIYGILANAADAISAARPGARSENIELYLQRLEKLESIACSFRGVDKCYALQAGREIRVIVEPDQVSDDEALQLARAISKKIQQELQFPGQIKVTVIRETRAIEYAK